MSNQVGLLPPQSKLQALQDLSRHPGIGGWKSLAVLIRPELDEDPESAQKWLDRALSSDRKEVFHDKHMRRALSAGAAVGCHCLMHWYSNAVGYQMPEPAKGVSRRRVLLEEKARLSIRHLEIQSELDELDEADTGGRSLRACDKQTA